jgi:hypothetical protein
VLAERLALIRGDGDGSGRSERKSA